VRIEEEGGGGSVAGEGWVGEAYFINRVFFNITTIYSTLMHLFNFPVLPLGLARKEVNVTSLGQG
jgi:hypothetical protein